MRRRVTVRPQPGSVYSTNGIGRFEKPFGPFVFTGDIDVEIEDLDSYVRVTPLGKTGIWTYRDPSGELEEGMLVEVPFGSTTAVGKVAALGRGSYVGPVKDVAAVLRKADL